MKLEVSQLKSEIYELKERVRSLEELVADFNKDGVNQKTKTSEARTINQKLKKRVLVKL